MKRFFAIFVIISLLFNIMPNLSVTADDQNIEVVVQNNQGIYNISLSVNEEFINQYESNKIVLIVAEYGENNNLVNVKMSQPVTVNESFIPPLITYEKENSANLLKAYVWEGVSFIRPIIPSAYPDNFKTYYIDSINGNDSYDGLSSTVSGNSGPWKTISKISSRTYSPGDRILFKKGCTFTGTLTAKGSGTELNPIIIGSYGTGNLPVINGNGATNGAIFLSDVSNWTIMNLELTNPGTYSSSYISNSAIQVRAMSKNVSGIKVLSNYIHDVITNGISFANNADGTYIFENCLVDNNTIKRCGTRGIIIFNYQHHNGENYYPDMPQDVQFKNIVSTNNYIEDVRHHGLLYVGTYNSLIANNRIYKASNGLSANALVAVGNTALTTRYNEVWGTIKDLGDADYGAINMENVHSGVVEYNYCHDNDGGGLLCIAIAGSTLNTRYRYNILQNNGEYAIRIHATNTVRGVEFYNNAVCTNPDTNENVIKNSSGTPDSITYKNNIFYQASSGGYTLNGSNHIFQYNTFYPNHPASEPADPYKITSNPMLINPGSGGVGFDTLYGYQLKNKSPCLNSGVLIPDNGGLDFWGNAVSSVNPPHRGAYNGTPLPIQWEFVSDVEGWGSTHDISNFGWSNGAMTGIITGNDPFIKSGDNLNVDITNYKKIYVRLKNGTPGTTAQIFFTTTDDTVFNENKRKNFNVLPNSDYTEYVIDMTSLATWTGTLNQFRIDPINGGPTSGTFYVDYIRIGQ